MKEIVLSAGEMPRVLFQIRGEDGEVQVIPDPDLFPLGHPNGRRQGPMLIIPASSYREALSRARMLRTQVAPSLPNSSGAYRLAVDFARRAIAMSVNLNAFGFEVTPRAVADMIQGAREEDIPGLVSAFKEYSDRRLKEDPEWRMTYGDAVAIMQAILQRVRMGLPASLPRDYTSLVGTGDWGTVRAARKSVAGVVLQAATRAEGDAIRVELSIQTALPDPARLQHLRAIRDALDQEIRKLEEKLALPSPG